MKSNLIMILLISRSTYSINIDFYTNRKGSIQKQSFLTRKPVENHFSYFLSFFYISKLGIQSFIVSEKNDDKKMELDTKKFSLTDLQ